MRGERTSRIEGSYRSISVHQLALTWWLHVAGHISRRQLRLTFACHELSERRRYAADDRLPTYTLDEIMHLVGGRGDKAKAFSEITRDLDGLRELGLVDFSTHAIGFAVSADQINLDDLTDFWSMYEAMPNRRRAVPVPRRMVRALAGGFSKATTAMILAVLIRGLFWHKPTNDYRIDGRYKLSWIADVFRVSRRAISDARTNLIELGWLEPLEVNQVMMNRFGLHDRIAADWQHPQSARAAGGCSAESASPNAEISAESASPDLTDSLPFKEGNQNTRNPAPLRAGPTGVSLRSTKGSRKAEVGEDRDDQSDPPNIRNIRSEDFASTDRLLDLHRQACKLGLSCPSEHGRMTFLAFAERAKSRGSKPGAMLFWFLREQPTKFITQAEEDEAARRLREHLNGPAWRHDEDDEQWGGDCESKRPAPISFTDEDNFVLACIRVGKARRMEPFRIAREAKGWTKDRWDEAKLAFELKSQSRWITLPGTAVGDHP